MTTTSTMSGLRDEKPTSRVSRPPGGASSNIFGTDDMPSGPPHAGKRQHAQTENTTSNIFGNSADKVPSREHSSANMFSGEPHKLAGKGRNQKQPPSRFNPITGEPYDESGNPTDGAPEEYPQPRQPPKQATSSFNYGSLPEPEVDDSNMQTSPGKALPDVHTSSRVINPPGGISHKLWWDLGVEIRTACFGALWASWPLRTFRPLWMRPQDFVAYGDVMTSRTGQYWCGHTSYTGATLYVSPVRLVLLVYVITIYLCWL